MTFTVARSRLGRKPVLATRLAREELRIKDDLPAARAAMGLTQQDVAERLGVCIDWVDDFEDLGSNPTLAELRYYCWAADLWIAFDIKSGKHL